MPAEAQVLSGDARCMPEDIGLYDILVTSPPYMPASSGRESYAKARAPSLIALGLESAQTVDDLADGSVGSMNSNNPDFAQLTARERRIAEWLQDDELRSIKAAPTARYFLDMRSSFREMRLFMPPGGMAIVVSGKQSYLLRVLNSSNPTRGGFSRTAGRRSTECRFRGRSSPRRQTTEIQPERSPTLSGRLLRNSDYVAKPGIGGQPHSLV